MADLSDRLFLALAAKAGYPTQPELVRCWGIVQARAREGKPPMTLFQACFTEGVMSVEQAARFSRWAEQVNQRDPGPLEASDSKPTTPAENLSNRTPAPNLTKTKIVAESALAFETTTLKCSRCGNVVDDYAVLEGRARDVGGNLECDACMKAAPSAPAPAALPPLPAPLPLPEGVGEPAPSSRPSLFKSGAVAVVASPISERLKVPQLPPTPPPMPRPSESQRLPALAPLPASPPPLPPPLSPPPSPQKGASGRFPAVAPPPAPVAPPPPSASTPSGKFALPGKTPSGAVPAPPTTASSKRITALKRRGASERRAAMNVDAEGPEKEATNPLLIPVIVGVVAIVLIIVAALVAKG